MGMNSFLYHPNFLNTNLAYFENSFLKQFFPLEFSILPLLVPYGLKFYLIEALYFDGIGQYRCYFHNRLKEQVTCPHCGNVYDRLQYKTSPHPTCPSRCSGPKN